MLTPIRPGYKTREITTPFQAFYVEWIICLHPMNKRPRKLEPLKVDEAVKIEAPTEGKSRGSSYCCCRSSCEGNLKFILRFILNNFEN